MKSDIINVNGKSYTACNLRNDYNSTCGFKGMKCLYGLSETVVPGDCPLRIHEMDFVISTSVTLSASKELVDEVISKENSDGDPDFLAITFPKGKREKE